MNDNGERLVAYLLLQKPWEDTINVVPNEVSDRAANEANDAIFRMTLSAL